jgi:uncharacterized protein YndB with AHSA1/START domain
MTQHDERRSIVHEVEVPGTPEQVWEAIATGPGISAWFVPTQVDGRPGGDVVFHLMHDLDQTGTITGWEPPARFAYEEQWPGEDDVTLATEFLVEARAGGTCVVRVVSTFSADGFEDDLDATDHGWAGFLDNLRIRLTYFRGQPAATISLTGHSPGSTSDAWAELRSALGLERVALGETVATDGAGGAPPVAGIVERVSDDELLIRGDDGIVGVGVFRWDERTVVAGRETCFGPDAEADAERRRAAWTAWLERRFPTTTAVP